MKIAIFTDTFAPKLDGVAVTARISARVLGQMGHQVRVYVVSKKSSAELTEESGGFYTVVTLPSFPFPIYPDVRVFPPLGFALRDLRKFKPDIIHVHTPFYAGIEGLMGARVLKIPVIGTHHTFFNHYLKHVHLEYDWAKKLSWDITVAFYNRMDLVISPTKSLRDELISNGLKKPVEVLWNTVDFNTFQNGGVVGDEERKNFKERFGISGKSMVYLGRVSYEKSINDIIVALVEITKKMPDTKLMIIGDGPEKEKLVAFAKESKIENNVIFTGYIQGKPLVEALLANDVFVTASKSENMPLVVIEAMSLGLPIVAVSSLGLREMVEDNSNGFLLPLDNVVESMRDAITKIFSDDGLSKKFSGYSKKLSLKYSEKEIVGQLFRIYEKTIKNLKK